MAAAYGTRPSQIARVADSWAAYQLDAATLVLGRWMENRLAERYRDGKHKHTAASLLGELHARRKEIEAARGKSPGGRAAAGVRPGGYAPVAGRATQIAGHALRKVHIGEDGIW
jgi:hypothetical protein